MMEMDDGQRTGIQRFYANKTVFLTGATGFLGCVVIEKLLHSCHVKKIIIIIRNKRGKTLDERKKKLFDNVIYTKLRSEQPNFLDKVEVWAGDCEQANLGISTEHREQLINEVEVMFHIAATVRFDEKLKKAIYTNVRSTRDLLAYAKLMPNLAAFVYVGTAYSHSYKFEIDEQFHNAPMEPAKLFAIVDNMDDEILEYLTPQLIRPWPNNYTYSKAMSEELIRLEGAKLPIAIVRPSVILGAVKEPIPGWTNSFYNVGGSIVAGGLGLLHVFQIHGDFHADVVPVDFVTNNIIAAGWDVGVAFDPKETSDIPIYNYTSRSDNPLTCREMIDLSQKHGKKSIKQIYHTFVFFTTYKRMYQILFFVLHTVPGYILDQFAVLFGKKAQLTKIFRKIENFIGTMEHFYENEWQFSNANVRALLARMPEPDRELFNFDMRTFTWDDYFVNYTRGVRTFLLNDPYDSIPAAQRKAFKLRLLHYAVMTALIGAFVFGLTKLTGCVYAPMTVIAGIVFALYTCTTLVDM